MTPIHSPSEECENTHAGIHDDTGTPLGSMSSAPMSPADASSPQTPLQSLDSELIHVTKDGGVMKRVLQEGHSDGLPPAFARCLGEPMSCRKNVK